MNAKEALAHKWFTEEPTPTANAFAGAPANQTYPTRRISNDEAPNMVAPSASRAPTGNSTYNFPRLTGVAGAGSGIQGTGNAGSGGSNSTARKRARLE